MYTAARLIECKQGIELQKSWGDDNEEHNGSVDDHPQQYLPEDDDIKKRRSKNKWFGKSAANRISTNSNMGLHTVCIGE